MRGVNSNGDEFRSYFQDIQVRFGHMVCFWDHFGQFCLQNQNLHKFKTLTKGAHIICLSRNSLITVFEAKKSLRKALGTYMLCLSSCHIDIWPIFVIFFSKSAYQIIFLPILMICEFIIGTLCWWWGPHKLAMFFL